MDKILQYFDVSKSEPYSEMPLAPNLFKQDKIFIVNV